MTKERLVFILFVVGAILFAIFVWPTSERLPDVRRLAEKDTASAVEFDAMRDTRTGRAAERALQAADDIKKMDEAVRKATEH